MTGTKSDWLVYIPRAEEEAYRFGGRGVGVCIARRAQCNAFWGVAMVVLEFWLRLWRHRLLPLGTFAAHINSLAGAGRRERGKPIQPAGGILFQLAHMLPRLVKGFREKPM